MSDMIEMARLSYWLREGSEVEVAIDASYECILIDL